ncbi:MAG: YtxH domain-containing protein [Muribaculaceae bacterium]|nr:YtxH domain-containing protein [Muribaculaceae bacterium]
MKAVNIFLLGAALGAVAGILFAPERGEDLRFRIKTMLKKKGYLKPDQIDILAAQIAAQIDKQ